MWSGANTPIQHECESVCRWMYIGVKRDTKTTTAHVMGELLLLLQTTIKYKRASADMHNHKKTASLSLELTSAHILDMECKIAIRVIENYDYDFSKVVR